MDDYLMSRLDPLLNHDLFQQLGYQPDLPPHECGVCGESVPGWLDAEERCPNCGTSVLEFWEC